MHDWSGTLQSIAMSPDGVVETPESREAIPSLLANRFDLPGFELDFNGKVKASDSRPGDRPIPRKCSPLISKSTARQVTF